MFQSKVSLEREKSVTSQGLQGFLESKPLYYKEIDYQRVHQAYALLKPQIKQPMTIHIVGTNGKGSTGRILAHLATKSALSVGHYTSPHIVKFNERMWLSGEEVGDQDLNLAHQRLFTILGKECSDALTYFEYVTLLAFVLFESCDILVLEAGLGGEFDATNVCDKALSIVTPIGLDHQDFLGETIAEIAGTKIRSIQKKVVLAKQLYPEVIVIAKTIVEQKNATMLLSQTFEDEELVLDSIANKKGWPSYLNDNASVAIQALRALEIPYSIADLESVELFGRFYPLTKNIHIDVGHNPLAAKVIEKALLKKVILVYNSLDDKAYEKVLDILKPKVKHVEIISIPSQRAATLVDIENTLKKVSLPYRYFDGKIEEEEQYLVFGSFYVVEAFLRMTGLPYKK